MKPKLGIILPVFNEEGSILVLQQQLKKVQQLINDKYEVSYLWINDGSTDKTAQILNQLKDSQNQVIHFISNFGKTAAIEAGFDLIKTDYVAILDTDLQDNPKYLPLMLSYLIKKDKDFVIGNRVNRYQDNGLKKLSSHLIKSIIKVFFSDLNISDINCGMKIMTLQVANSIYLKSDYHRYLPLIAHLKGFKVGELPVFQRKRKFGVSKYGLTGLTRTWKSFSDLLNIIFINKLALNPFSLFGRLGIFSTLIGILILLHLSSLWFLGTPINSRPLFFLGILSITTGLNFLSIGLIGDLIKLNKNDRDYVIRNQ